MIIESLTHLEGVRELKRRLEDGLAVSARYMDAAAFEQLRTQIFREIASLESAIKAFEKGRNVQIVSEDWLTVRFSTESVPPKGRSYGLSMETAVLIAPLRRTAQNLETKPASSAGLVFA